MCFNVILQQTYNNRTLKQSSNGHKSNCLSSFSSVTFPIKGPIVLIRHIHKTIVHVYDWKETKIFYLILHLCAWATCIWFSSFLYMNYHEYIYNKNLFLNGPKETSLFYQIMNSSSITSVFFQNNFQWKQLISHIKTKLIWLCSNAKISLKEM